MFLAVGGLAYVHAFRSTVSNTSIDSPVLEPSSLLNHSFPLFDSIDGGAELKSGRWLLLFYHYDCDECRHVIPLYRAIAKAMHDETDSPRLAFIAVPPFASASQDPGHVTSDNQHYALRSDRDWIVETPMAVTVLDGRVIGVTYGEQAENLPDVLHWQ